MTCHVKIIFSGEEIIRADICQVTVQKAEKDIMVDYSYPNVTVPRKTENIKGFICYVTLPSDNYIVKITNK